jgi:hypothetical protein
MKKKFAPHGNCDFVIDDNIIIISAYGPWNKEFFYDMHTNLAILLPTEIKQSFGLLVLMHGETLATAEGLELHFNGVKHGNAKAIAIDLSKSFYPEPTKQMFQRVYAKANLENDFFSDKEKALTWLKAKLAKPSKI